MSDRKVVLTPAVRQIVFEIKAKHPDATDDELGAILRAALEQKPLLFLQAMRSLVDSLKS